MSTDIHEDSAPTVSVLLPAYNAEGCLGAALESLLAQTFSDFEIVVVDDGSTDRTPDIIRDFAARDERVVMLTHERNLGLVESLNDGLRVARGEFVARLDADDAAYPSRLERQVAVLGSAPDVVLCATAYERVDTAGRVRKTACPPLSHAALAGALLTGNCLSHSSVMFRRSSVLAVGGYLSEWFPAEDYDLWIRLIEVGRYQGVQVVGVRYLENPTGVSSSTALLQTTVASRRAAQYVARWSARPPNVAAAAAFTGEPPPDSRGERTAVRALERGARGIAASLRARHITRKGLFAAPLGASLQLMRGRPPLLRHLCLLACAPRLTLLGRIDRIRAR